MAKRIGRFSVALHLLLSIFYLLIVVHPSSQVHSGEMFCNKIGNRLCNSTEWKGPISLWYFPILPVQAIHELQNCYIGTVDMQRGFNLNKRAFRSLEKPTYRHQPLTQQPILQVYKYFGSDSRALQMQRILFTPRICQTLVPVSIACRSI